jgi:RNA polymerase sigma-70 factor (ECF subfamily)
LEAPVQPALAALALTGSSAILPAEELMFGPEADREPELPRDDGRDRELLQQIAGGERKALEQLYFNYHGRLGQFLSRLTGRRDAIEEAINDTFWIVWQKAAQFRGDSRPSTWIMGIAWRCGLKALRRSGPLPPEHGEATLDALSSIDSTLAAEELREWLDSGLRSLPVEQRATMELAYFLGHSCEEIGAIMNCPVNTVKARMFQARIKLRNLLPTLAGAPSKEKLNHE